MGEGFSISLIGTTFPWYKRISKLVLSQSVKQRITVDLSPHILANVVDIQKVHLLLHTPLLNKTARTFVEDFLVCCLYIVYMYQWQNQHALPLVPGWILVPPDPWRWQEELLCSVVMALQSKLCAALHDQSYVGSMCDCKPCRSFTYQFWGKFYQELTVTIVGSEKERQLWNYYSLIFFIMWMCSLIHLVLKNVYVPFRNCKNYVYIFY